MLSVICLSVICWVSFAECHLLSVICWVSFAECHLLSVLMLYVLMLSVLMLCVLMLCVLTLSALMCRYQYPESQYAAECCYAEPWTNLSWQDKPWAEFSTLEVAACHAMHLLHNIAIWSNLGLKDQPKQLLGSLPLDIVLPAERYDKRCDGKWNSPKSKLKVKTLFLLFQACRRSNQAGRKVHGIVFQLKKSFQRLCF